MNPVTAQAENALANGPGPSTDLLVELVAFALSASAGHAPRAGMPNGEANG